ncbi:MAG TPA: YqgE/AlgH family protein [Alphaproteobacteria bacterium]|jgi:putative transcriptional regulator|nr:YqgE/AlgH family protein [Alphaproteobacteria bacterium]
MTLRLSRLGPRLIAVAAACLVFAGTPRSAGSDERPAVDPGNLTGKLLVAAPSMDDPNFAKSVIFMVEHNEHGALGIVINRVLGAAPAAEVLKGLGIQADGASGQIRVFLGGPVEPQVAFVLHSTDYSNPDTRNIADGVAVTGDAKILEAISRGEGPHKSLLALGYAGWGPGQLESEMARDSWYVAPADPNIVFGDDITATWKRALATSGVDL